MRLPAGRTGKEGRARLARVALALAALALGSPLLCRAQENPLGNVQTPGPQPPPPKSPDSNSDSDDKLD